MDGVAFPTHQVNIGEFAPAFPERHGANAIQVFFLPRFRSLKHKFVTADAKRDGRGGGGFIARGLLDRAVEDGENQQHSRYCDHEWQLSVVYLRRAYKRNDCGNCARSEKSAAVYLLEMEF